MIKESFQRQYSFLKFVQNVLNKQSKEGVSTSSNSREKSRDKKYGENYKVPRKDSIKIIDLGGATYEKERHTDIINTRQYRAPEVILRKYIFLFSTECQNWTEKSDVWSIACILSELYYGELFFPTHNDYEHLCLIEKASGAFPNLMVEKSKNYKDMFELTKNYDGTYVSCIF